MLTSVITSRAKSLAKCSGSRKPAKQHQTQTLQCNYIQQKRHFSTSVNVCYARKKKTDAEVSPDPATPPPKKRVRKSRLTDDDPDKLPIIQGRVTNVLHGLSVELGLPTMKPTELGTFNHLALLPEGTFKQFIERYKKFKAITNPTPLQVESFAEDIDNISAKHSKSANIHVRPFVLEFANNLTHTQFISMRERLIPELAPKKTEKMSDESSVAPSVVSLGGGKPTKIVNDASILFSSNETEDEFWQKVNEMEKPEKGKSLDSQEYKFVMVGVPSEANDQDIARGIVESLIDKNITVNKVEFFYDKVANKRRKNAFISVDGQEELDFMLDDQTRAFGINVLGQRTSIMPPHEKRSLLLRSQRTTPKSKEEWKATLKQMNTDVEVLANVDIFVPSDDEGQPLPVAFVTFPSHKHAYELWKGQSRESGVQVFWSTKFKLLEEAMKVRDTLAVENTLLKEKLIRSTSHEAADKRLIAVISNHIQGVYQECNFDEGQAASVLGLSTHKLHAYLDVCQKAGFDTSFSKKNTQMVFKRKEE